MKRFSILLIALFALITAIASPVLAGLVIDVKAVSGTGYTVSSDGKNATFNQSTANINFQVWATISGTNATTTDDQLLRVTGGFVATQGTAVKGGLIWSNSNYCAPFDSLSTQTVANVDLNGDGYADIGNQSPAPYSDSGYFLLEVNHLRSTPDPMNWLLSQCRPLHDTGTALLLLSTG